MSGWRPPSSLGNFACKLRKEDCASPSVFCDESCTTNPLATPSAEGGMAATRGLAGCAAAGSPACGGVPARGAGGVTAGRGVAVVAVAAAPCAPGGGQAPRPAPRALPPRRNGGLRNLLGSPPPTRRGAEPPFGARRGAGGG